MAIRTPNHPTGFGPPPTSPLVIQARDYLDRWIRVTVPYDDTTKVLLDAITTHRDVGCLYSKFLIGGTTTVPIAEGDGVFLLVLLGVTTLSDLDTAGTTFEP